LQELLEDIQRRENTRRLAQIADEQWASERRQKLAVTSGEEALNGNPLNVLRIAVKNDAKKDTPLEKNRPAPASNELPAQDPGATFQPQGWSGKIGRRE
jgi:hypothetical protein